MAQGTHVVTGNTGVAIQAGIDQASGEGGGVVFLPARVYTLSGALKLKSNVRLVGAGASTVLQMGGSVDQARNLNFIELEGVSTVAAHDIEISTLTIRGPGNAANLEQDVSDSPDKGCGIIAFKREVRNVVIRACHIENVSGCGISFRTPAPNQHLMEDIVIEDCRLFNNKRPGEREDDKDGPDAYKDIYFSGRAFKNIRVEGNVCSFEPNASSTYGNDSGIGFVINGQKLTGFARNIRLVGNVCAGHRRHGLVTNYDMLKLDWAFVSDNRCQYNGWAGIYVNSHPNAAANARVVVSGNYCQRNGFSKLGSSGDAGIKGGIVVLDAENIILANNICMENGVAGPFQVENTATSHNASGIRIRGKKAIIEGNLVQGNRGSGVSMWPSRVSEVSIVNNRAVDNRRHGIEVAGVTGDLAQQVVVTGNVCTGNTQRGIHVSSTGSGLVASNYVANNGQGTIFRDGSSQGVVLEANVDV